MSLLCPSWFVSYAHQTALFDCFLLPYTQDWRIRRRTDRLLKKLKETGVPQRGEVPETGRIYNILLFTFTGGLGDALYVNGLIHYLVTSGIKVEIATLPKVMDIHRTVLSENAIHNILDAKTRLRLAKRDWDVVVDLAYFVVSMWEIRADFLSKIHSPIIGLDRKIQNNPLACSEFVDVSKSVHIGNRWAQVASRITGRNVKLIPPYVGLKPRKQRKRYLYINTVGSAKRKELSQSQVEWITDWLNEKRINGYFYSSQNIQLKESPFVKKISPFSFTEACRWVGGASGVITPDTSITHIASAYGIPQLTFFTGGNSRMGFEYTSDQEFAPIGKFIIVKPRKKPLFAKEIVPISAVTKEELETALQEFFAMVLPQ